jgi:hypothetical protein
VIPVSRKHLADSAPHKVLSRPSDDAGRSGIDVLPAEVADPARIIAYRLEYAERNGGSLEDGAELLLALIGEVFCGGPLDGDSGFCCADVGEPDLSTCGSAPVGKMERNDTENFSTLVLDGCAVNGVETLLCCELAKARKGGGLIRVLHDNATTLEASYRTGAFVTLYSFQSLQRLGAESKAGNHPQSVGCPIAQGDQTLIRAVHPGQGLQDDAKLLPDVGDAHESGAQLVQRLEVTIFTACAHPQAMADVDEKQPRQRVSKKRDPVCGIDDLHGAHRGELQGCIDRSGCKYEISGASSCEHRDMPTAQRHRIPVLIRVRWYSGRGSAVA